MYSFIKNLLGLTLIVGLIGALYLGFLVTQTYDRSSEPSNFRSFTVSGDGKAVGVPDVAGFSFEVITEGDTDVAKLQTENAEKMNASIDEAIKYYEHALANNPDHDLVADALYHLGQYYFEQDEKDYFAKLAIYSEARDQGRDDVAYPEENFTRTIDTYEKLIKEFPDYAHMDSVYYLYSLALWYEGVFYNAVENFKILNESTSVAFHVGTRSDTRE